jgi:hypothetical protein
MIEVSGIYSQQSISTGIQFSEGTRNSLHSPAAPLAPKAP